jgi:3-hydroxyacyl-CoA dehydrogenase/3a,7a,12a-trihydroxy-5b-cholest-24-enoyl-CoA hydratase
MSEIRFDGKVVIVTGAGAGIGRKYALFFAARGAKVVVNDLGGSVQGQGASSKAADTVVQEIKAAGGVAVANYDSVEFGDKIVKTAMDAFGRVDILINNAGILKDIAFQNMSEADWNIVLKVHLQGTFAVTRAAWNIMREQNYGRIINTASGSGLYGNFGQANYSAAKLGIHGLTSTLAKEGERRNIRVNTIAPVAATRMTETVLNKEVLSYLDADNIVPLVAYLCHDTNQESGSIFELGGGYIAKVRFQRSQGALFDMPFTPEQVRDRFNEICDYSRENEYPTSNSDAFPHIMENVERIKAKPKATPTPAPAQTQTTQAAAPQTSGPALKSDKIFAMMNNYLAQGLGKDIIASLQSTYTFEITPKKGAPVAKSFIIDLKNGNGKVFEGKQTTDATFTMVDDDFEDVCLGKLNPQNAFMQGKMKIKGNMKKATAFTPELFPPPTPENFAKFLGSGATTQAAPAQTTTATKTAAPAATASSGLKCEAIFKLMDTFLSRGEGKHLVAQLQATYMFEITPKKGAPVAKSYIIDLKNGNGRVYEGKEQVDAIFTMVDEDFEAVCLGKLNPQNAFMQGKMKIKGNMKKATAFTPELFPPPTPENFAKYNSAAPAGGCPVEQKAAAQTAAPTTTGSGLKSDGIFAMMAAFMDLGEAEKLVKQVDSVYIFEILQKKGGPVVKKFVIDLKNGKGKVYEGTTNADATFTMVDEDFEAVCLGKLNPQNAFMQGKMKIKGNMKKATLFTPELFPPPTPENVAKYIKPKL